MEAPDPPDRNDRSDKSKGKRAMGATEPSSDSDDYEPTPKKKKYRKSARKPKSPSKSLSKSPSPASYLPAPAPGNINLTVRAKTGKATPAKDKDGNKDGSKETWDVEGFPKKDETDDDTLLRLAQEDPEEVIKSYPNDLHKDLLWIIASKPEFSPLGKFLAKLREHHPTSVFRKVKGSTADDVFRNRFSKAMTRVQEQFGPLDGFSSEVFPPHSGYHNALTWRGDGRPRFIGLKQEEKDALKAAKKAELKKAVDTVGKKDLSKVLKDGETKILKERETKLKRASGATSTFTMGQATRRGTRTRVSRRTQADNVTEPPILEPSSEPNRLSSEAPASAPAPLPPPSPAQGTTSAPPQASTLWSVMDEGLEFPGFPPQQTQYYPTDPTVHSPAQFPTYDPYIGARGYTEGPPTMPTQFPLAPAMLAAPTMPTHFPRGPTANTPFAPGWPVPPYDVNQPMAPPPQPIQTHQDPGAMSREQREARDASLANFFKKWDKDHPYNDQTNHDDYYKYG